jgi:hypothetical protein
MKIRSFFSAVTACIAAFCGASGDGQPPQQYVNRPRPRMLFTAKPKRAPKLVASDRFYSNQRQRRKDARRANAAGVRNAFSR